MDIATQFMISLSVEFKLYTIQKLHRRFEEQERVDNPLEPGRATWHGFTKFDRLQTDDVQKSQTNSGNTAQNLYYVFCMQSKGI